MGQIKKLPPARLRRLNIRLSQQEWDKIHKLAENTTCRSVSEYARKVLAEKPVKVFYRNQSFDAFEEQMLRLLPILAVFGGDFNELIKKLQTLKYDRQIQALVPTLVENSGNYLKTVDEIKFFIEKLVEQCDPKS